FVVRAKAVVVACGSFHTPVLLRRSGLDSKHGGRPLTLHSAVRVGALWDERIEYWDGALQSVYSDQFFKSDGLTFVAAASAPSILTAAFPGTGAVPRRLAEQLPHLGVFGGMIHDEGGGAVHRFIGHDPIVT